MKAVLHTRRPNPSIERQTLNCMKTTSAPLLHVVTEIVGHLVTGNYTQVLLQAPASRVSAAELEAAVGNYGRHLVLPPNYDLVDFIEAKAEGGRSWSVVVPMYTEEEGRSDLSLELTVREFARGEYEVKVDDLHVL